MKEKSLEAAKNSKHVLALAITHNDQYIFAATKSAVKILDLTNEVLLHMIL